MPEASTQPESEQHNPPALTHNQYLNSEVDEPVVVEWIPASTPARYGRNRWLDPTDMAELEPSDLSPEDKGHIYSYWPGPNETYIVQRLYGGCDAETGKPLQGLTSMRAQPPFCGATEPPRAMWRMPSAVFQTFRINAGEDWDLLRRRFATAKFRLSPLSESVVHLADEAALVAGDAAALTRRIRELDAVGGPNGSAWNNDSEDNADVLTRLCGDLVLEAADLREMIMRLYRVRATLTRAQADAGALLDPQTSTMCQRVLAETHEAVLAAESLDVARIRRTIEHGYNVATGAVTAVARLATDPLVSELVRLQRAYPALNCLSIPSFDRQDELRIRLAGVEIDVRADGTFTVTGDPNSLTEQRTLVHRNAPSARASRLDMLDDPEDGDTPV